MIDLDTIFRELSKVLTPAQKRNLMDRLGCKTVQEVKDLSGDDFDKAYAILIIERAKRLTAAHVSFSLNDDDLYRFRDRPQEKPRASFIEKSLVDG